jgi:catechol 2,3-dioxygenase-like lactoylglutathione lyase family enzyme
VPFVCKYIALYVPDLRAAEEFYGRAFAMDVLFRETERDGSWWTLPAEQGWDEALAAGVEVRMVALRRDDFVLALFPGAPAPGTVHETSLGLAADDVDGWRARPPDGAIIVEQRDGFVRFDDPFGLRWVLQDSQLEFRGSGEIAGRWLEV